LLRADDPADNLPKPGDPERAGSPYSLMAVFTILAFREGGEEAEPAVGDLIQRATTHFLASQEADGSWKRFEGRPPFREQKEGTTLLAEYALGPQPQADDPTAPGRAKIRQWLAANSTGEGQQVLNFRILVDYERQASVEQLLKLQQADGGWSQTKELPTDAYATGQAIYALVSRGGIEASHPTILKAREFLARTQQPDGSWVMPSRPPNNGNTQDPSKTLEPIIVGGTSWALLGLLQCIPPVQQP
jgi:squalene-hopene/tetraprenyl-beta-curcumene cyclase